jgi:diguanylate cyclase (GGDEF)-like protein
MAALIGVLGWFRQGRRDERVGGWLLGLGFLFAAMLAGLLPGLPTPWGLLARVLSLNASIAAAACFCWSGRAELLRGRLPAAYLLLPVVPLLGLATMCAMGVSGSRPYLLLVTVSVLIAEVLILTARIRRRWRMITAAAYFLAWLPMLYLAGIGAPLRLTYWGIGSLYLLVAYSFARRISPGTLGAWVAMVSFVAWGLCWMAYPATPTHPGFASALAQTTSMLTFFVVIGMLLVLLEDEMQRRKAEAMHDPLTGLPNRRLFNDRLAVALERSRRSGLRTAVFAIDLNDFKGINDRYGHHAGDLVLTGVASRLKHKVRGADTVARCGGDEFLVIINDLARPENCPRIAAGLRAAIESVTVPGTTGKVGGSVGFAVYPDEASTDTRLCELADQRMYEQKAEPPL